MPGTSLMEKERLRTDLQQQISEVASGEDWLLFTKTLGEIQIQEIVEAPNRLDRLCTFSGEILERVDTESSVIERRKLWKVKVDSFGEDSAPGENAEEKEKPTESEWWVGWRNSIAVACRQYYRGAFKAFKPSVGTGARLVPQSPDVFPGAHVFGVEQRQLERMAMGSMCSHQDTDTLANVAVDLVLHIWAAKRRFWHELVPRQVLQHQRGADLARRFSDALVNRFEIQGRSLRQCRAAPRPELLRYAFKFQRWLVDELQVVVVPKELAELFAQDASLNIPEPDVTDVLQGFRGLPEPQVNAEIACKWLFEGFEDAKEVLARSFRDSVHLLRREDDSYGNFEGWTWYIEGDSESERKAFRDLILGGEPSKKVVMPNYMFKKHFDESLGVLRPHLIAHVALSPSDVNAAHFWHLLNLGAYRGQEEDLPQLVGKLKIRARRWDQRIQQIQQISVPCGEHCVLAGAPNQAEEALLAVGCQLALDPVPAAFAGSTPWHVAKHVEWLRMNDLLQVEAALDEHKEKLCEAYLNESMDPEVLKIFVDLPIIKVGESHLALSKFSIVGCPDLALAAQRSNLKVLHAHDPRSKALAKANAKAEVRPFALLQQHQAVLARRPASGNQEILLTALRASDGAPGDIQMIMQLAILNGQTMESLWNRQDPLAAQLGAFDGTLTDFVTEAMKLSEVKRRLKSTLRASQLVELLQQYRPKDKVPGAACERFTGSLLLTVSKMELTELNSLETSAPFADLQVFFLKGQWRKRKEVIPPKFQDILSKTNAPVLEHLQPHVACLFAERPPLQLVVEQLCKLAEGKSTDWKVAQTEREEFLKVYKFLDENILDNPDVLAPLKTVRCILDAEGTLRVAGLFSLGLMMDMGPLSAVAADVKPFQHFLIALGARESASDRPLPEPMVPEKLMQEMVKDTDFVDVRIDCNDGSMWAHRIVCCNVCSGFRSKLLQSTDRGHWLLQDKAPCSSQTLAVIKDIIYSGRVDSHRIDQMSNAERQECLRAATWFGMSYAQEWLQQYNHGAHPEELETAEIKMPKHWNQTLIQQRWRLGPRLESVSSQHVLEQLKKVLIPHDAADLGHGRDCRGSNPYNFLELHQAWRIENFHLWRKFQHEVLRTKGLKKNQSLAMHKVSIRKALVDATQKLPEPVAKDINEVFLLHGTKPPSVKKILSDGLNERFSGGLFGHGSYLAEDPAKSDQYATPDARGEAVQGHVDEPPRNVCYMFLCRAVLGRFVQTKDGEKSLQDGRSIWSTPDRREFNTIPRFESPYHSLQVETGGKVQRHREYILTHSERIYPEYLIAYKRQYR